MAGSGQGGITPVLGVDELDTRAAMLPQAEQLISEHAVHSNGNVGSHVFRFITTNKSYGVTGMADEMPPKTPEPDPEHLARFRRVMRALVSAPKGEIINAFVKHGISRCDSRKTGEWSR
jgi:hypothetical protein